MPYISAHTLGHEQKQEEERETIHYYSFMMEIELYFPNIILDFIKEVEGGHIIDLNYNRVDEENIFSNFESDIMGMMDVTHQYC